MSQSPMVQSAARFANRQSAESETVVRNEDAVQDLLDAFNDAGCRAILDATSGEALSASEVSEACDLPLSTTYRKLDQLTDAGLLEERTRIRRSGKHASEYARLVEDMVISLDECGEMELRVSLREDTEQLSAATLPGVHAGAGSRN
nr:helix-turn-helix domain-containing protein [Halogeometricum borinquense]